MINCGNTIVIRFVFFYLVSIIGVAVILLPKKFVDSEMTCGAKALGRNYWWDKKTVQKLILAQNESCYDTAVKKPLLLSAHIQFFTLVNTFAHYSLIPISFE